MSDVNNDDDLSEEAASSSPDIHELRRRHKAASRARLLSKISALHRSIHKPLSDVVRDHALPLLPARSLLRFISVSKSWAHTISSPLFAHRNSSAHRSISGLFFHRRNLHLPSFAPFPPFNAHALPPDPLAFASHRTESSSLSPRSVSLTVVSSCNGLLLLSREDGAFVVCNPVRANQFVFLPRPPVDLRAGLAAVLIYKTGVYNFRPDYFVVVPFRIDGAGLYGFQCFSSTAGAWWVSDAVCAAEWIIEDSGAAAGGVAYWRTTMQTVVGYEPAKDSVREVAWPMNYESDVDWRIGCAVDRLYATAVTAKAVSVFRLFDGLDGWLHVWEAAVAVGRRGERCEYREDGSFIFRRNPECLGFQSGELEFVFLVSGRVAGVDIARRRVRWLEAPLVDDECWRFVSHINTFAAVVPLDVNVEDENFRVKEEEKDEAVKEEEGDGNGATEDHP